MAKVGAPPHEPTEITRAKVSSLVAFGIPQDHIANMLQIDANTLAKHYRYELDTGQSAAIDQVANKLFSKAVDQDDLQAQIFFLKTRGRWREKDTDDSKDLKSIVEKLIDKLPAK